VTPGEIAFKLAYEISPIVLTGGVANFAGGALPLVAVTEAANFVTGLLSGGNALNLDNFFAHFRPLPGTSLIEDDVGHYPFANQAVAANAVIARQLKVSLVMTCPARPPGGWAAKLATMTALKTVLNQHRDLGGTYTVATPSFFFTNCLLLDLRDVTPGDSSSPQRDWQWDFEQPLLTLQQADQALGNLMGRINSGAQVNSNTWTNPGVTVGQPQSGVVPSTVPVAGSVAGSGVSGAFPLTAFPMQTLGGAFQVGRGA
jgi:hypothetical protein